MELKPMNKETSDETEEMFPVYEILGTFKTDEGEYMLGKRRDVKATRKT